MDEKMFKEVFSDQAFVQSLFELSTAEEVRAALKGKGLEFSLEEIEAIRKQLAERNDEMGEADLNSVAGGTVGVVFQIRGPIGGFPLFPPVPLPPARPRW